MAARLSARIGISVLTLALAAGASAGCGAKTGLFLPDVAGASGQDATSDVDGAPKADAADAADVPDATDATGVTDAADADALGPPVGPASCALAAAQRSDFGCEFWPTVVANNVWSIFDFAVVIGNPGSVTAQVRITGPNGFAMSGAVAPGALETFYLPWVPALKGPDADECGTATRLSASVRAPRSAYHVTTSEPVAVAQFDALEYKGEGGPPGKDWSACPGSKTCASTPGPIGCFAFSNDASLLLPTTTLGAVYRVTGLRGWSSPTGAEVAGAVLTLTGTQDATSVTVTLSPNAHLLAGGGLPTPAADRTMKLTLDAGDVIELVGAANGLSDFSGSLITASAPIQVVSGMPCTQVPQGNAACDHIEETVLPADTQRAHFVVVPPTGPRGDAPGHVVRFYGLADGTTLSYVGTPPAGAPTKLDAGDVVFLTGVVKQPFEVTGSRSFAVVSFMIAASLADPTSSGAAQQGDPSQSNVIAVEQFASAYGFLAPDDYPTAFADVVAPPGTGLVLDGVPVVDTPQPVGGFVVHRIRLGAGSAGAHRLIASAPVGVQIAGYGSFTSYYYPGGMALKPLVQ